MEDLSPKASISLNFKGFTKFSRIDYVQWKLENKIQSDGVNAKLLGCHGPLPNRQPRSAFIDNRRPYSLGHQASRSRRRHPSPLLAPPAQVSLTGASDATASHLCWHAQPKWVLLFFVSLHLFNDLAQTSTSGI